MDTQKLSETNESDNTYQIAKQIFSKLIQPPKTYSLQLEEASRNIAEEQGVNEYIQGMLSIITVYGIEILYGHRDLNKLNSDDIETIKMYVKSYGYSLDQKEENGYLKWVFTAI
jgi:hypothetical protein